MNLFNFLSIILYSLPQALSVWLQGSKKLYIGCMASRDNSNYHLIDEVEGAEDPTLDTCLSKCRAKGATYMVLKVKTCYCSEILPTKDLHPAPDDHCIQIQCPEGFMCGRKNTLAIYTTCPSYRYGRKCEKECYCKVPPCRGFDGFCLNGDAVCQKGFVGTACNLTDPCTEGRCLNGGECGVVDVGLRSVVWKCFCAPGFYGDTCAKNCPLHKYGDDCVFDCFCADDKPCYAQNGSCLNGCDSKHHGKDCSLVDACESGPCRNGGVCYPDEDSYFCDCVHNFTGSDCRLRTYENELSKTEKINKIKSKEREKIVEKERKEVVEKAIKEAQKNEVSTKFLNILVKEEELSIFYQLSRLIIDAFHNILFDAEGQNATKTRLNFSLGCFHAPRVQDADASQGEIGKVEMVQRPLDLDHCKTSCREKNYKYAAAMGGEVCMCGNSYGKHGHSGSVSCHMRCGNGESFCGARTLYNVYTVCNLGFYGKNCESKCHCTKLPCEVEKGVCEEGLCRKGWTGVSCDQRIIERTFAEKLYVYLFVESVLLFVVVLISLAVPCFLAFKQEDNSEVTEGIRKMTFAPPFI